MKTINVDAYYSNGAYGRNWGVRRVVALEDDPDLGPAVRFAGVAGRCRRQKGLCSLAAFEEWARHEVRLNENSWQRIATEDDEPA